MKERDREGSGTQMERCSLERKSDKNEEIESKGELEDTMSDGL